MEGDNDLDSSSNICQGDSPVGPTAAVQDVVPNLIAVGPVADKAEEEEGEAAHQVIHGQCFGDHVAACRSPYSGLHQHAEHVLRKTYTG